MQGFKSLVTEQNSTPDLTAPLMWHVNQCQENCKPWVGRSDKSIQHWRSYRRQNLVFHQPLKIKGWDSLRNETGKQKEKFSLLEVVPIILRSTDCGFGSPCSEDKQILCMNHACTRLDGQGWPRLTYSSLYTHCNTLACWLTHLPAAMIGKMRPHKEQKEAITMFWEISTSFPEKLWLFSSLLECTYPFIKQLIQC